MLFDGLDDYEAERMPAMQNTLSEMNPRQCRACNNIRGNKPVGVGSVYQCAKCQALFGTCYKGESYLLVKPFFVQNEPDPETTRYFDFTTLGSEGLGRRHGWFDPATKLITQVG